MMRYDILHEPKAVAQPALDAILALSKCTDADRITITAHIAAAVAMNSPTHNTVALVDAKAREFMKAQA